MNGQGEPAAGCYDILGNLLPGADRNPACMGDPAMATAVPVDQYRRSYDFLVPSTYSFNMANVVVPDGVQVTLDGVALSGSSVAAGSGFRVFFVPMTEGRHRIEAAGDNTIGITVYGIASYTSYMYPGGLDLQQISPPG